VKDVVEARRPPELDAGLAPAALPKYAVIPTGEHAIAPDAKRFMGRQPKRVAFRLQALD
jgi:hypothetical protein